MAALASEAHKKVITDFTEYLKQEHKSATDKGLKVPQLWGYRDQIYIVQIAKHYDKGKKKLIISVVSPSASS